MKVIGLGSPDERPRRFDACEMDVLVDVLRDLRAKATRDAVDTYATTALGDTRPIDERHDRLRGLDALLIQLEEQPPDNRPGATVIGATHLMRDVAREGAREALERLHDAHERYEEDVTSRSRGSLLGAAKTAEGVGHDPRRRRSHRLGRRQMTRPNPSAPGRQAAVVGVCQPPARTLPNLTAARALRSLEVLVFHAGSAPGLAATMGIHDRTARRLLYSLEDEGYVQSGTAPTASARCTRPPRAWSRSPDSSPRGCHSLITAPTRSISSAGRPASTRTSSSPAMAT